MTHGTFSGTNTTAVKPFGAWHMLAFPRFIQRRSSSTDPTATHLSHVSRLWSTEVGVGESHPSKGLHGEQIRGKTGFSEPGKQALEWCSNIDAVSVVTYSSTATVCRCAHIQCVPTEKKRQYPLLSLFLACLYSHAPSMTLQVILLWSILRLVGNWLSCNGSQSKHPISSVIITWVQSDTPCDFLVLLFHLRQKNTGCFLKENTYFNKMCQRV